jgi:hypothetical protein
MASPTLEEILLGGFAYFVEAGTTVDGQVVGPTIKPDVDPTSNWTNGSLGDVLNFEFDNEKIDSPYLQAQPTGGHAKINRSFVVQDWVLLQTRQMSEIVWRLKHGLAAKIVEGTAQTPGAKLDRKIEGWLRLQGRALNGYDRFLLDWWCEVRLESKNKFDEKVVMPVLRFTQIRSVNGVPVAGNSDNFPAAA